MSTLRTQNDLNLSTLDWNKYMNNDNTAIINQYNLNKYLKDKQLNNNFEKNLETKVSKLEIEYQNDLKEMEELCNNINSIDIYKKYNSLQIIQKEHKIIKLLTVYILQNNNLNFNFFESCIMILFKLSEILRIRINQPEISHEKLINNNDNLLRCSYKFCSFKENCIYNYNKKANVLCYQDHYVHNMVSADLLILMNYIKKKRDDTKNIEDINSILHNKEILKTINTLSFVISHMELELKNKCIYLSEDEYETVHIIKNK
jgi:hypothetical protein